MSKEQKSKLDKSQTADDILASLMEDLKDVDKATSDEVLENDLGLVLLDDDGSLTIDSIEDNIENNNELQLDISDGEAPEGFALADSFQISATSSELPEIPEIKSEEISIPEGVGESSLFGSRSPDSDSSDLVISNESPVVAQAANYQMDEKTAATEEEPQQPLSMDSADDGEKTVAVAGFSKRSNEDYGDKVKVSVGQVRGNAHSSGYAAWGSSESNLVQAENLRIAQDKILNLEKENERLRFQNEELIAASEIVKERADLLTSQLHEYKSDRDSLEQSFKNETGVLKNQLMRKDAETVKATMKVEELETRMKFDLKKIRVRERELENRLELIRAEKNALVKSKDEQILDMRRKLDQVQLEVESYRQKCVELNKVIDTNQESFKRTTRALRLAMANLEIQEENKPPLKKVD